MNKDNIAMGIMTVISIIVITGGVYITEQAGLYFNTLVYTRSIFAIGIAVGLFIFMCSQYVGFYLTNIAKWLRSKKQQWELNNESNKN